MEIGRRIDDDFDVKKANIRHHDVEAEIFEIVHPEGSSLYERAKVLESLALIVRNSKSWDLCFDIGCGTGFVTGFELPLYGMVVATDISRKMVEVAKKKLIGSGSINFVICDVEFLPFKREVADLVSVSSVLHHLPKPFNCLREISRILKKDGFVYITREPSFKRFRRFFDFFDYYLVEKILKFTHLTEPRAGNIGLDAKLEGLDYGKVDVHYSNGFHMAQLSNFLLYHDFDVVSVRSYHWIYPDSNRGWFQTLLTKINFLVEKLPLADRFGRYVSIIARKHA